MKFIVEYLDTTGRTRVKIIGAKDNMSARSQVMRSTPDLLYIKRVGTEQLHDVEVRVQNRNQPPK